MQRRPNAKRFRRRYTRYGRVGKLEERVLKSCIPMRSVRSCLIASVIGLAAASPLLAQAFTSKRVVKAKGYVSFDKVHAGSSFRLAVAAEIDEGWHVNANEPSFDYLIATSLKIEEEGTQGITIGDPIYPPFKERTFAFTGGETLRVYEGTIHIGMEATAARELKPQPRTLKATLTVQACDDKSCLAPARLPVEIPLAIASADEPINAIHPEIFGAIDFAGGAFPSQAAPKGSTEEPGNVVGGWVERHGWALTLGLIFLGGLALNLTPCVYPLIPITLAYFGGQTTGKASHTFTLASIYVLGMCVTYSLLGVLAATTGSVLGSALQSPMALGFVAVVLAALGLSMFGLYDIQVPAALRSRITSRPGRGGALFMGLTVGLVAAPCVGPFVVSLLAFVGQAGSPLLGFWLFFVLALGLGLPYLILGGVAGAASGLPRAGAWMDWVKKVFGFVMFAMAFYFINPLLPGAASRLTVPLCLVAAGVYLGLMEGSPIRTMGFRVARAATALACVGIAAWLLMPPGASASLQWEPFSEAALSAALDAGRPAIIDFTADWCLPCKELDHFTFSDPRVVAESGRFVVLKADITSSLSESVEALRRQYEILGAPTIVFIDSSGEERTDLRLTGFENAEAFLERMRQVAGS